LTRAAAKDGSVTHGDVIALYAGSATSSGVCAERAVVDEAAAQAAAQAARAAQEARRAEARAAFRGFAEAFNEVLPRVGGSASGVPFHECSANPFIAGPQRGRGGATGARVDLRVWL
jgi:hypothetical protein